MSSSSTLVFSWDPKSDRPLIIGCNREDYYDAPIILPHVWKENPDVIAEKDVRLLGGTWFGVTKTMRWGAVSHVRDSADAMALEELMKGRRLAQTDTLVMSGVKVPANSIVARTAIVETLEETEKSREIALERLRSKVVVSQALGHDSSIPLRGKKNGWALVRKHFSKACQQAQKLKAFDEIQSQAYLPPTVYEDTNVKEIKPKLATGKLKGLSVFDLQPNNFGEILSHYLLDPDNISPLVYLLLLAQNAKLAPFSDHSFSVILGDSSGLYFYANNRPEDLVSCYPPGVYTFTCAGSLNPGWPKFQSSVSRFLHAVHPNVPTHELIEEVMGVLASTVLCDRPELLPETGLPEDLEMLMSSMFIANQKIAGYGTRSSTVVVFEKSKLYFEHREFVREVRPLRFPPPPLESEEEDEEDEEEGDDDDGSDSDDSEDFFKQSGAGGGGKGGGNTGGPPVEKLTVKTSEANLDDSDPEPEVDKFVCDPDVPFRTVSMILQTKPPALDMTLGGNIVPLTQAAEVRVQHCALPQARKNAAKLLVQ
eukprot:PhF_6_TR13254/c0_g1_i1/m.21013